MLCPLEDHLGNLVAETEPGLSTPGPLFPHHISMIQLITPSGVHYPIPKPHPSSILVIFRGMVLYLLGPHCTEANHSCRVALGKFKVSLNGQHY